MSGSSSLAAFKASAKLGSYFPFIKKIRFTAEPVEIYRRFANPLSPSVLLESARLAPSTGRTSIIAGDPFLIFESKGRRVTLTRYGASESFEGDPLAELEKLLGRFSSEAHGVFSRFTGGAIGYFGYEVKNLVEPHLPQRAKDDLGLPDIYLLFFDEGVVVDHREKNITLFSNVLVGRDLKKSYGSGLVKLGEFEKRFYEAVRGGARRAVHRTPPQASRGLGIRSDLNRRDFIEKVGRIKRYIRGGEIYQANLSQRFRFAVHEPAFSIYEKLRAINPSPFFGFLDARRFQIVSGSPERLIKLENGVIETRPIAGTRSRGKNISEDLALSRDLALDEKERAEHIMLVDLERNDMGRVAEYGSVRANELMVIEDYSHVKHIVSNVRGRLRAKLGALDVLKAFFPGGTITGAPKVRCMEILDEIEPVARGPYAGSLGYLGFNGQLDLNIIIRSLVIKDGEATLQVGAGIVADSVPGREYDETLYKAAALFKAIFGEEPTNRFFDRCRRP